MESESDEFPEQNDTTRGSSGEGGGCMGAIGARGLYLIVVLAYIRPFIPVKIGNSGAIIIYYFEIIILTVFQWFVGGTNNEKLILLGLMILP